MLYSGIIPKKLFEIDSELSIFYPIIIRNLYILNFTPLSTSFIITKRLRGYPHRERTLLPTARTDVTFQNPESHMTGKVRSSVEHHGNQTYSRHFPGIHAPDANRSRSSESDIQRRRKQRNHHHIIPTLHRFNVYFPTLSIYHVLFIHSN